MNIVVSNDDQMFDYSVLVEMSRMVNTFMLTDELLEFSLEVFMECAGQARGIILVFDHEHKELYARTTRIWDLVDNLRLKRVVDDKLNYLKLSVNTSLLERIELNSTNIVDLSSGSQPGFSEIFPTLWPILFMYRLTLIIPLVHHGQFKGLVALGQPVASSSFAGKQDRQLLIALADLTATCLENIALRESAVIDSLTRVYTKRFFQDRAEQEIERAGYVGQNFSILMLDIDKFKQINDLFGHPEGDKVLRQVAEILRQNVRDKLDFVGRYGGDEFVLYLFGAQLDISLSVAERIRKDVAERILTKIGKVTISIGVSAFPAFGKNFDELIASADSGMYKSKEAGGNHVATAADLFGIKKASVKGSDYNILIKDRVTEFYVGEYFYKRLEEELERSRRYQHNCSLVAITIDHYQTLRGMVARRELDGIMSAFSSIVLAEMRKGVDIPARYLNDTVIFILPETTLDGSRKFAMRMAQKLLAYPFTVIEGFGPISFNFALAVYPADGEKGATLMQNLLECSLEADKAGNGSIAWRNNELKTVVEQLDIQ